MTTHRTFTLAKRPEGELADSDLTRHEEPIAAPAEGQIQVRTTCISIDPTNRIWMSDLRPIARDPAAAAARDKHGKLLLVP